MKIIAFALASILCAQVGFAQNLLDAPRVYDDGRRFVTSGDVDGDGDIDLIGIRNGNLVIFWNQGSGEFVDGPEVSLGILTHGFVAFGDVTGDGVPDIVVDIRNNPTLGPGLYVFTYVTGPGITGPTFIATPNEVGSLKLGDMNSDGVLDVLVGIYTTSPYFILSSLRWYVSNGAGAFQGLAPLVLNNNGWVSDHNVSVQDLDADGDADLAVFMPDATGTYVTKIFLSAGGVPQPPTVLPTNIYAGSLHVMDADGDADLDLVFSRHDGSSNQSVFQVWAQTGVATWTAQPTQPLTHPIGTGDVAWTGDWDSDGDTDLFFRSNLGATTSWPSQYVVYANDGSGGFSLGWEMPVTRPGTYGPGMVDVDGDGRVDFVGPSEILMNNGSLQPIPWYAYGFEDGLSFDFDGDGDLDLVRQDAYGVSLNDGQGRHAYPVTTLGFPQMVNWLGDLNGDGLLDAITSQTAPQGFLEHRTYFGQPGGTFQNVAATTVFPGIELDLAGAVGADMNGDSQVDLVTSTGLWFGQGGGTFAPMPNNWGGLTVRGVKDVDGDGDKDVLISQPNGPQSILLGVLWNVGTNAFLPSFFPASGAIPETFVAEDLDGDGDAELIFATDGLSPSVVVVESVGMTIGGLTTLPGLPYAVKMITGDLDLDGHQDLLLFTTGYRHNDLEVIFGDGTPSFASGRRHRYVTAEMGQVADVDADGDLDVIGVSLSRNRAIQPPQAGSIRQYGTGTPGMGGLSPLLGASGPLGVGQIAVLHLRRYASNVASILTFGLQESSSQGVPLPGLVSYNEPWAGFLLFPGTQLPGYPGFGALDVPFSVPQSLTGVSVFLQAGAADPLGPSGIVVSNGLQLTFGQ